MFLFGASLTTVGSANQTLSDTISPTVTPEQVSFMSEVISEYGASTVLMAVFILLFLVMMGVFFFIMIRFMKKESSIGMEDIVKTIVQKHFEDTDTMNEEMHNELKSLRQQEINTHIHVVEDFINKNTVFKESSKKAMDIIHADRIAIYLFHNGSVSPYDYHFEKISCVHELTSKGTCSTTRGKVHDAMPLYRFADIVNSLKDNGEFIIEDTSTKLVNYPEDPVYYSFMTHTIHSMYAAAIIDNEGYVAAFTIAEYTTKQDFTDTDFLEKNRIALRDLNNSIRYIITNQNFVDGYNHKG